MNKPALIRSNSITSPDQKSQSPIDFQIGHTPAVVKIPANQGPVMVNVMAKLKNSYQLDVSETTLKRANSVIEKETNNDLVGLENQEQVTKNTRTLPIEKYNHLLIGTVKDTQIMFSFFVEASIIEGDKGAMM